MYKSSCLGIIAPVGVTLAPVSSKYVSPQIGDYISPRAYYSRIIPPASLVGMEDNAGGSEFPIMNAGVVATSSVPTEVGRTVEGIYEGVEGIVQEVGGEMPDWLSQIKDYLPTGPAPEETEMPEVIDVEVAPSFFEKHKTLLGLGALGVLAYAITKR